jgi:hypothetical protein
MGLSSVDRLNLEPFFHQPMMMSTMNPSAAYFPSPFGLYMPPS